MSKKRLIAAKAHWKTCEREVTVLCPVLARFQPLPRTSCLDANYQHMNKLLLILLAILALPGCKEDEEKIILQPDWRYFRFSSCPLENHGNWQDTSFVAATANTAVVQQCLAQLELPLEERSLFPLGSLSQGWAGYNTNATHRFSWHLVEDDWELVEMAIEIYDGCAYSDVELTNYTNNVGRYGGWGNRVLEEITLDD